MLDWVTRTRIGTGTGEGEGKKVIPVDQLGDMEI